MYKAMSDFDLDAEKHSPASSVQSTDYIKPELLAVALVLYLLALG